MTDDEAKLVISLLKQQLGKQTDIVHHDLGNNSPMSVVISRAQDLLDTDINVFWTHDAKPQMFAFEGFSTPVLAFSPRLIEIWGDFRFLFADDTLSDDLKVQSVRQLALQFLAELTLWDKKADSFFSLALFLKSATFSPGIVKIPNTLQSLEMAPINAVYLCTWFFALSHEIGHFDTTETGLNPENIRDLTDRKLDEFDAIPTEYLDQFRTALRKNMVKDFEPDNILRECQADIFATGLICDCFHQIMERSNPEGINASDLGSLIYEIYISINFVAFMKRCTDMALLENARPETYEDGLAKAFFPATIAVRAHTAAYRLAQHLDQLGFRFAFPQADDGTQPSDDPMDQVLHIWAHDTKAVQQLEAGLSLALNDFRDLSKTYMTSFIGVEKQKMDLSALPHFVKAAKDAGQFDGKFSDMTMAICRKKLAAADLTESIMIKRAFPEL